MIGSTGALLSLAEISIDKVRDSVCVREREKKREIRRQKDIYRESERERTIGE